MKKSFNALHLRHFAKKYFLAAQYLTLSIDFSHMFFVTRDLQKYFSTTNDI